MKAVFSLLCVCTVAAEINLVDASAIWDTPLVAAVGHGIKKGQTSSISKRMSLSTRSMSFRWHSCWDNSKELLRIHNINLLPDPLVFPGTISVSFNVSIKKTVDAPLKVAVLMEKTIGKITVKIPCIGDIGSCTYDDLCEFLQQIQCPQQFTNAGVPCQCPFNKGEYKLPLVSFTLEDNGGLPPGDYHIRANLSTETDSSCHDIYFSVA